MDKLKAFSNNYFYQSIVKTLLKVFLHSNHTSEQANKKIIQFTSLQILSLIIFYIQSAVLLRRGGFPGVTKIIELLPVISILKYVTSLLQQKLPIAHVNIKIISSAFSIVERVDKNKSFEPC